MITYRELAEYMLHLIQDEGKMDAQNHIGTATYDDDLLSFEDWCWIRFRGKVKKVWGEIKDNQKLFYIYYDKEDTSYMDSAMWFFTTTDCAVLETEDGQKIMVYAIQPEICITYKA